MMYNELYYCYGLDKNISGTVSQLFVIKVIQDSASLAWCGCELLPPMTAEEAYSLKIENVSISKNDKNTEICKDINISRLPAVHNDNNGLTLLALKAFEGKYHRLNPKKLWPSKTSLLRTITVLGETHEIQKKYITYWMTNRKIQMLDESYDEYGYYVCDYNGATAYLTFEQMQTIGNRYGFTNARVNGNRITKLDGNHLPRFTKPADVSSIQNTDRVLYVNNDESTDDFEIGKLRCYADTFFTIRRQRLAFDENTPVEDIEKELNEILFSVEAFHQALLWKTVPKNEYESIAKRVEDIFSGEGSVDYLKAKSETLSRVKNMFFTPTLAFNTMLEKCGTDLKRMINLNTLVSLNKDIQDSYSAILLAEQEITEILKEKSKDFDYSLFGLDYRIKSPNSLYEKLYERSNDSGKSIETLFEETRDVLRYTVCFNNNDDYCKNIKALLENIMDKYSGQLECFRNYWTPYVSGEYKGVNATVRIPDMCWDMREKKLKHKRFNGSRYCITIPSFCFEIQFHTISSLEIKEKNHRLYEKCRRNDISEDERQHCFKEMKNNISSIIQPKGAEYLNMMSNEYITALYDSIRLMESELCEIGRQDNRYVDIKGLIKGGGSNDKS